MNLSFRPDQSRRTLFGALRDAARAHGLDRKILVDGDGRVLTYKEILRASLALGSRLSRDTQPGETIGVLLPTGIGSVLAVLALSAYGRVPAMLNFTSGEQGMLAALKSAKITRIVTAHRFIDLGKFEALEATLAKSATLIYLEETRAELGLTDKVRAVLGSFLPGAVVANPSPDTPAVILFTSGTEGEPKGVALSHANILANIEQVRAHIELFDTDVLFNPLPTFHSFGLTVGVLTPLYLGIQAILHPTPRQPHEIARRIREYGATILLATDTFISQYARAGDENDLASLRLAVCGAERVRDETRQLLRRKYHIELLEGYGVTEAAPVIAANQIGANHPGTVGHVLPGIETRIEKEEGILEGGRLLVRGPNIMLGYLKTDAPGKIVPPEDGWHDTGDIVAIDDEGFMRIGGRLKRFAKIGGESVSLTVVENCASSLWPDFANGAVSIPDPHKGEQIVLVTTFADASRADLVAWAHSHGVSELAVPRRVMHVTDIPVLGTGKTDYPSLTRMVLASP